MIDDNASPSMPTDGEPGEDAPTAHERDVVIAALAAGATQEEAGRLVNRSARTVRRWKQADPQWDHDVKQQTAERAAAIAGRLTDMSDGAARVLEAALEDDNPRIRLRAAELILVNGVRLRRTTELDDALDEVLNFAKELQATYERLAPKEGSS